MTWERTAEARSEATPERVWAVLTDGRRWPAWNPGIAWAYVEGALEPGRFVTVKPARGRQTAMRIDAVVPDRVLALALTIGPAAALHLRWELAPEGGGTALAQVVAIGGPLGRLLLGRAAQRIAAGIPGHLERLAARAQT